MKPDMDLYRRILIRVVEETPPGESPDNTVRKIANEEGVGAVYEHVGWLKDDGLLEATRVQMDAGPAVYHVRRVTKVGVDFYTAVQSDNVWTAVKERVADAGGFTVGILLELAKAELKQRLGLG